MEWLDNFKIAVIEEDANKISSLISSMPNFNTVEECREAMALIEQAYSCFVKKKDKLAQQMRQIETSKKFLLSSKDENKNYKLDIHS